MIKCLAFALFMALTAVNGLPNAGQRLDGNLIRVGLDDDPRRLPDANWRPPIVATGSGTGDSASLAGGLEAEVLALRGAHDRWVVQYRRTTVGVSPSAR